MAAVSKRNWRTTSGEIRSAWRVDYVDNQGNRRAKQFPTKKIADRFRIEIENSLLRGTYRQEGDKITLKQACGDFLDYCDGRLRRDEKMTRKNLTVYRGHIKNWILHSEFGLGKLTLSQLTARHIGRLRDDIRDQRLAVVTTRKIISTLHAVLAYAISQDWIATNPSEGVRVIGTRAEEAKKIIPPSKETIERIIQSAKGDFRLQFIFAASTGLRAGEQWALPWRNVDFDKRQVRVDCRVDAYGEFGPPKSAAGIRDIPLSHSVLILLREWKLLSPFSKLDDLVFANRSGRHFSHDNIVKRHLKPSLEQARVATFNWHSIRHFAISTWIEAGLAPKTVQTFAGHSSLRITMDRYGHLFPSAEHHRAMDRIAKEIFNTE